MMSELFDEEAMRKQLDVARERRLLEERNISVALELLKIGKETHEEIAKISRLPLDKVKKLAEQNKFV